MIIYFFYKLYSQLVLVNFLDLIIIFNESNNFLCDQGLNLNSVIVESIKSQVGFVEDNKVLGKHFIIFIIYDGLEIKYVINNLHTLSFKSDADWYWVFTNNKGEDQWYICNYVEKASVVVNNKEIFFKLLLLTDEYQYWEYFNAWPLLNVLWDIDTYYLHFDKTSYMYGRGFMSTELLNFENLLEIQNNYLSSDFQKFYILSEDKDKGFFLILKK